MSTDPRGPYRRIANIDATGNGWTLVTFECGHTSDFNPIYVYRVGDRHNCLKCRSAEHPWSVAVVEGRT